MIAYIPKSIAWTDGWSYGEKGLTLVGLYEIRLNDKYKHLKYKYELEKPNTNFNSLWFSQEDVDKYMYIFEKNDNTMINLLNILYAN